MDDISFYTDVLTYLEPCVLLRNQDGLFFDVTKRESALLVPRASRGVALGDFDNDGRTDILIANNNSPAVLLRNECDSGNNWIKFKLVGHASNRNGIGAKLRVMAGNLIQMAEVKGGGSYLSACDMRPNFGIGKRDMVDLVEITWPSGRIQRMTDLEPNRIVTVKEP
jgi:enediyne biosynthesis protein E4